MSARTHWVEVNETRLFQYGNPEWWIYFRHTNEPRIRIVSTTVVGDTALVACDDRDHANLLRAHMLREGVPASAAKVRSFRQDQEPAALGVSS